MTKKIIQLASVSDVYAVYRDCDVRKERVPFYALDAIQIEIGQAEREQGC